MALTDAEKIALLFTWRYTCKTSTRGWDTKDEEAFDSFLDLIEEKNEEE